MCKQSQHNLIKGDRPCELMRGWTCFIYFGEFSKPRPERQRAEVACAKDKAHKRSCSRRGAAGHGEGRGWLSDRA